jgi:signal transduction histidine kinase
MGKPLRVLIVEDREDDAELLLRALHQGGYEPAWQRVETREAMDAMLEQPWDLIVSDWSMPRFSAMAAFALLKEKDLDLPFIIVSGTIGEETAVEAMKAGVQDFMTKGHLSRLVPAVERELREVEIRRQSHKMKQQLLISERMAALGTLAAGITHEINNPLGVVVANVEMATEAVGRITGNMRQLVGSPVATCGIAEARLREMAEQLGQAEEAIALIGEAAERMRLVARDLKVFSHPEDETFQGPVNLENVIESSLRMASTEIRHRAEIVRDYRDVPPAEGNESRLGQIFLNLLVNAAQSMPEGNVAANRIGVSLRAAEAGRVMAEIWDTGNGIPQEVLPRIFDPFFTTKPSGIGTGLGLAICHRLIVSLGGEISVESEVGKGTKFRILLPAAQRTEIPSGAAEPPHAATQRASILVIDDEPGLQRSIVAILRKEHDVIAVGDAQEAMRMIKDGGMRFDLIICDLMMPNMTGMDLHAEFEREIPGQADRMAFMTGGVFTDRARAFLARFPDALIEKPFTVSVIRNFIRQRLSAISSRE